MLRDGAGDSLLSAKPTGARRSMCGRDKGAFFGKADVNGIQNCDANTTVCAPRKTQIVNKSMPLGITKVKQHYLNPDERCRPANRRGGRHG